MIDFDINLRSYSLLLRPVESNDIHHYRGLTNDESMWIYFTSDLSVDSELEEWVSSAIKQRKQKIRLAFTVIDLASDTVVGSSSLGNISWRDKRVEIGWTWLGRKYQSQGINAQVKHLMLKYCFDDVGFVRVEFKTDMLNCPARKALENLGIVEEGILRSHTLMTHGRRRDTIFYSSLISEWPSVKEMNGWA